MNKRDKKLVDNLIHSLALKNNMSDEELRRIVESPYEFAFKMINELDLEGVETEEQFDKLKTNFIFPEMFRLIIDFKSLQARNNRRKNIKKINKKNE